MERELISAYYSISPREEIMLLKRDIKNIDLELKKIAVQENFMFKEFKIPYLNFQKIETDPIKKEVYMLRAELDYKFFVLKGLRKRLYGLETYLPNILKLVKNDQDIILFDINKNFSQEQISKATIRSNSIISNNNLMMKEKEE